MEVALSLELISPLIESLTPLVVIFEHLSMGELSFPFSILSNFSLSSVLLLFLSLLFLQTSKLLPLLLFTFRFLVGEGDFDFLGFAVDNFLLLVTELVEIELGDGDFDLLLLVLTPFPVTTKSVLLTDLMPLYPNTGVFRDTVFVAGA